MDPKKVEVIVIAGAALAVVAALMLAGRGGSGISISQPSDSAVASIEAANAQATASANALSASKITTAAQALVGIKTLQEQQAVAGLEADAQTTQAEQQDSATVQEAQIASQTTLGADSIIAQANEIVQKYVSDAQEFQTTQSVAGAEAIATTQASAQTTINAQNNSTQKQANTDSFLGGIVKTLTLGLFDPASGVASPAPLAIAFPGLSGVGKAAPNAGSFGTWGDSSTASASALDPFDGVGFGDAA